jgi:hypothetical protein
VKNHSEIAPKAAEGSNGKRGGIWRGIFLHGPDGRTRGLNVMASWAGGWDHVSVSVGGGPGMTPTWNEMEAVRRAFFHPHETVVQLHPPISDYICVTRGVLHLWRCQTLEHPLPPRIMV